MLRLNLILLVMLLLAGCRTATPPVIAEVKTEKATRIVDTMVKVVPDSSILKALLDCDSLGRVHMKQISEMQLKGIGLDVKIEGNSLSVKAKGKDAEKVRIRSDTVYREKPIRVPYPVETNKITSWQWLQIWVGRIACLMVLLYLGYGLLVGKSKILITAFKKALKLD